MEIGVTWFFFFLFLPELETKPATKNVIPTEDISEDLSQDTIVEKFTGNSLWDSTMARIWNWDERILRSQNSQESHLSQRIVTQKKEKPSDSYFQSWGDLTKQ